MPQWDKNTLMAKSEVALAVLLEKLDDITQQCDQYQYAGGGPLMDDAKFQVSPGASARRVVAHQERRIRLPSHMADTPVVVVPDILARVARTRRAVAVDAAGGSVLHMASNTHSSTANLQAPGDQSHNSN